MRTLSIAFVSLYVVCPVLSQNQPYDPDEGSLSSIKPQIPEPMVFDLIRPLGAERGELEVNSLFRYNPRQNPERLLWAPEVEYAFLEGYGVEFELPMENAGVESWKGAVQGTLPGPWKKRFIQGWQALAEIRHGPGGSRVNLLYLAGARWHRAWSVFSMTGVEHETGTRSARAFLGNYSVFYHLHDTMTFGVETNLKGRGNSGRSALLMPQVQWRKHRLNVQAGTGWQWAEGLGGAWQIGWRLSREF